MGQHRRRCVNVKQAMVQRFMFLRRREDVTHFIFLEDNKEYYEKCLRSYNIMSQAKIIVLFVLSNAFICLLNLNEVCTKV